MASDVASASLTASLLDEPDKSRSRASAFRQTTEKARDAATERFALAQQKRGMREAVEAFRSEQRTGAALLAGGLAYRLFLWLVPFGLVVAAIASFWVRLSPRSLEDTARSLGLGGVAARSATTAVEDGSRARWYLLVTGVVVMIWAGISAVRALRVAARLAWGVEPGRLRRPVRASATFAAVCVTGLATSLAASWGEHKLVVLGLGLTLVDALVYAGLALFALSHLPRAEGATWRDLWPGAALTGLGLACVQIFVGYFLARRLERAPALYGGLGASTVVLLVLFVIARLLVAAMFLNASIAPVRADEGALRAPRG